MKKSVSIFVVLILALSLPIPFSVPTALAFFGWAGANNSPYIPTNAVQPYDINVSLNDLDSENPCMVVDANGIPHIVWQDRTRTHSSPQHNTKPEIMYVRWDPIQEEWVGANGSIYDPTVDVKDQPPDINVSINITESTDPKIVLDSNNRPHIAWTDKSGNDKEIFYVRWDPFFSSGPCWVRADGTKYNGNNADVSQNLQDSYTPSLDLDSNDIPYIAWVDEEYGDKEILCVYWDTANSWWACTSGIRYHRNAPNTCRGNVSDNSHDSIEPCLVVNKSTNRPSIAWADRSYMINSIRNYEIIYVTWNGTNWIGANGTTYNTSTGANAIVSNNVGDSNSPSLRLDSNGRPHIAWSDYTCEAGIAEILYVHWDGTQWLGANGSAYNSSNCGNANVSDDSAGSFYPSLELDSDDHPHLAWQVNTNGGITDIIYVKWEPSLIGWFYPDGSPYSNTNADVSDNVGESRKPCLALDLMDSPHLVWFDNTYPIADCEDVECENNNHFETLYVHWHDQFTGFFDFTKGVDTDNDQIFDDIGDTAYFGTTIRYRINWMFTNPDNDPLTNAYVYDEVPNGTTYVTGATGVPDLSYSTDSGATWTQGEPPNGSPAGTILRWFIPNGTTSVSFEFSVLLLELQEESEICNVAWFSHARDEGEPLYADEVCITSKEEPGGGGGGGGGGGEEPRPIYYTVSKGIDIDGNGVFNDAGESVDAGDTVEYEIKWHFENPDEVFFAGGYIFDKLPQGTSYIGGSATKNGLAYSTGGPFIYGDPPGGMAGGTLRWTVGSNWIGESHRYFDPHRPTQPSEINVSLSSTQSDMPSVAVDSNGTPHVAWQEKVGNYYDIYYVRWNRTISHWVGANGSVYDPTNLSQPSDINVSRSPVEDSKTPVLKLDGTNNPHIVFVEDRFFSDEIYFLKWDTGTTSWVGAAGSAYTPGGPNPIDINVSSNIGDSYEPRMQLNLGVPHIVWTDESYGGAEIMYVTWNGSWQGANGSPYVPPVPVQPPDINVSSNPFWSMTPSLALFGGTPMVAWVDTGIDPLGDIYFVKWSTTLASWATSDNLVYNPVTGNCDVSLNSGFSRQPSLAVDGLGAPHIAWTDTSYSYSDIIYIKWQTSGFGGLWVGAFGNPFFPNSSTQPYDINVSRTHTSSSHPSLALDFEGEPNIAWMDYSFSPDHYGDAIAFLKWDALTRNWVGADNSPYLTGANHHHNGPGVVVSKETGYVHAPQLVMESSGVPRLVWADNNYSSALDIICVKLGVPSDISYKFKVNAGFTQKAKSVCNFAYFQMIVYQNGESNNHVQTISNNSIPSSEVCCMLLPSLNQPFIELTKTAVKSQVGSDENIAFRIIVKNTGRIDATDVVLFDNAPNILKLVTSKPPLVGTTRLQNLIGTLKGGASIRFDVVFKLKNGVKIPDSGLYILNVATVTCAELEPVTDNASVIIVESGNSRRELSLWTAWRGITIKTSEGEVGKEITLSFKPEGGTSPYDVKVDWGDGTVNVFTGLTGEEVRTSDHTYSSPGDYTVSIQCIDSQARSTIVKRILHIK